MRGSTGEQTEVWTILFTEYGLMPQDKFIVQAL